ncbi:MAG: efflux RND transporter periplasmic adaptor subunit [Treponema sp.]|nr:efflux RND transporter periplasmic adaptor subunit [Treponema sp.]
MRRKLKQFIPVFPVLIILLSGCNGNDLSTTYEFTPVRRGTVERIVTASGRINPVSTIRVLPQMSGKVERIYVDFNDTVNRGDILAELNTDMLRLRREQQYAAVLKARANFELQQLNYNNQLALAERNLISDFELLTSRTNLNNLAADLAVAEANLRSIDTEINQFAYITSPIDGIVLNKTINEGDTVVDSSNASSPAIFTLAENLSEMQIEATVGELDVTSIYRGQQVRFTLESLPGRTYSGIVETLRLVPTVTNNVVSYTVIVRVENHDGSLLPGMTCAVDFIVERSENALIISNAALRYQPTSLSTERIADMIFAASLEGMTEEQRTAALEARDRAQTTQTERSVPTNQASNTGIAGMLMGNQPTARGMGMPGGGRQMLQSPGQPGQARTTPVTTRNLWYIGEGGNLEVMQVMTGISSGSFTELIISDDTLEGRQFILRERF